MNIHGPGILGSCLYQVRFQERSVLITISLVYIKFNYNKV